MKGDIENLKKALQDLLKQKQRQSPLLAKRKVTREVSAPTATATEKAATATAPTPTPPPITNTDPETETETEIETQDVQPEISPTPISEFSDEDDDLTNIINDITQLKKITQQLKVSVDSKLPTKIHSESQIETLENLAEIDVQLTLLATTKLEKSLFSEELAKYEESILKKMKEAATQQSPETDTTPTTKTTTTENRGESALEFKIRELGDRVGTNKLNLDKLAGELHDSVLKLKEDSVSRDFVEKQVSERSAGGVEEDEKYIRATTKLTHSIYFAPFSLGAAQARNFADEGKAADANADGHGRCQRQDWGAEQGARGEAGPREHRGYAQGAGEHRSDRGLRGSEPDEVPGRGSTLDRGCCHDGRSKQQQRCRAGTSSNSSSSSGGRARTTQGRGLGGRDRVSVGRGRR